MVIHIKNHFGLTRTGFLLSCPEKSMVREVATVEEACKMATEWFAADDAQDTTGAKPAAPAK